VVRLFHLQPDVVKEMLVADNHPPALYTAGTIQMVPGRTGYEPAFREDTSEEAGFTRTSRETGRQRSRLLNGKYETTYTESRRLRSFGTSSVGSFIDIYA
jgi:hypothetical protein